MVVANSKCLLDRQVATNRRQTSQRWPRLHRLKPLHKPDRLLVAAHHQDPREVDLPVVIIRPSILRWGLRHT